MGKTKYKPPKLCKQTIRRLAEFKEREEQLKRIRLEQEAEEALKTTQSKKDFMITISREQKYIIEF